MRIYFGASDGASTNIRIFFAYLFRSTYKASCLDAIRPCLDNAYALYQICTYAKTYLV